MKRIFPAILLAALVSWGCHKKPAAVTPAPPQVTPAPSPASATVEPAPKAVTPPPEVPPTPQPVPLSKTITPPPNDLELGQKNFLMGNYPQAIKSFEVFLQENPKAQERDRILFQLGIARALAGNSVRDLLQAEVAFKQLLAEFPTSPYRDQAEFILNQQVLIEKLRSDVKERDEKIKKLTEELQTLKEIDLQRRPSRPE